MGLLRLGKKGMATVVAAQLLLATQSVTLAQAEMLGTEAAINKYTAIGDRAALMDALDRNEIQAEMAALGIDPTEAATRLAALSDAEVATILQQMENDSAGADIIGTLFTVFVILLVTDLLCFTNAFPFTRCIR